jgi:hypothetical protein
MLIEISALLLESVSAAVGILSEGKRRRNSHAADSMVAALLTLDFSSALASTSDARLAAMMRGAMSAAHLETIVRDPHVGRIMSEMVLATVVEDQSNVVDELADVLIAQITSLLQGQVAADDIEFFAAELARTTRTFCSEVLLSALKVAPNSVINVQQLAVLKRTQAILQRVSEQLAATKRSASFELAEQRQRFLTQYREVCAEVHGSIKPPDFETNQRIPIESLYVAPTVRPLGKDDQRGSIDPAQFSKLVDRTVLLGDPGGGKSTLSNFLTMTWARDSQGPIPFHVTLREFALESDHFSVVQYIESQLPSAYQLQPEPGAVEDFLLGGNAVLIFDGLDELTDPTKRRAMTTAVETFAFRYPMVRIFVTSRRVGYEQAQLDPSNFELFGIDGFNSAEVSEYVHKWFASQSAYTEAEAGKRSRDFVSQSQAVKELSANPLMLSLMCIIFRGENFIPRNRPAIYEKCANLLFEKWDGHRQIEVPLQARDHVDAAMKHVAFVFLESGSSDTGIKRETLVREMTTYLYPRAMETEDKARRAAEEFVDFCAGRAWVFSDAGTTADGEPIFTFTHRTFMEYFAAVHLIRTTDTPEKLAQSLLPRIAREEWDVVAQLAVQQSDKLKDQGTERALTVMLDDSRRRTALNRSHVLHFIVRCCEFAVVSPAFLRRLAAVCFDFFASVEIPAGDRMHFGLDPLLRLQDYVSAEQTEIVIDATRKRILEVLERPDDSRFEGAVFVSLLGLIRRFNGRLHRRGEHQRSVLWDDAFQDIATKRLDALKHVFEHHPSGWANLILGGVVTPAEGIGHMRAAGLQFSEIYLLNARVQNSNISGVPLAISVAGAFQPKALRDMADRNICEETAREFLADFHQPSRSRMIAAFDVQHARDLGFGAKLPSPERKSELPSDLLDFLTVVAMAMDEVDRSDLSQEADSASAQKLFDPSEVSEIGLSPAIESFALRWHSSEETIFDLND